MTNTDPNAYQRITTTPYLLYTLFGKDNPVTQGGINQHQFTPGCPHIPPYTITQSNSTTTNEETSMCSCDTNDDLYELHVSENNGIFKFDPETGEAWEMKSGYETKDGKNESYRYWSLVEDEKRPEPKKEEPKKVEIKPEKNWWITWNTEYTFTK